MMSRMSGASIALLSTSAIVAAAALATAALARRPAAADIEARVAAPVRVEKPTRADVERTIGLAGAVDSARAVTVASKASGTLVGLSVDVGDRVARGSPVGLVDAEPYRIALEQAKAAEAAARTELERARRLYEGGSAGRQALDAAQAKADAASSQRELASVNFDNCSIVAPVGGVVVSRSASPGALVSAGSPIVALDASAERLVAIQVPERYAAAFMAAEKPRVALSVPSAGILGAEAELRAVSPMVKPDTRTFEVLCALRGERSLALPGMSAKATFILESRRGVPTLPVSALADGRSVWSVDSDARARRLDLPSGEPFTDGARFELPETFAGMDFIVEGHGFLSDGDPVGSWGGDGAGEAE